MSNTSLDNAIQSLPPELREIICKELIAEKQKERAEMGWDEVHEELKEADIRDSQDQIGAEFNCGECGMGVYKGYYPLCYLCKVAEVEIAFQHEEEECRGCFWCTQPPEEEID